MESVLQAIRLFLDLDRTDISKLNIVRKLLIILQCSGTEYDRICNGCGFLLHYHKNVGVFIKIKQFCKY